MGHSEWGYHPGIFDQFSLTLTGHSHPAASLSAFLCRKRQLLMAYQLNFNGWHITGNHHRIYIMSDSAMQNHFALFPLCEGSPPVAGSWSSQRTSKGAFTLARAGVRVRTAGPALRAHTECSHMNKERAFTLVRADVRARMRRKTRRVSCRNFPHPQAFLWLVHDNFGG